MDFFDGWKPVWRWLLFLPLFFVTYFVLNLLNSISLGQYIGPYDESSIFNFVFYRFYIDTICLGGSIIVSSMCIPKGKIVLASTYLAIILIIFGLSLSAILMNATYFPAWKMIYSSLTTIAGGIGGLVYVISLTKQEKAKMLDSDTIYL